MPDLQSGFLDIGGGASKKLDKVVGRLDVEASSRVAQFENNAGIIGAAPAAREKDR